MKKIFLLTLALISMLILFGCKDEHVHTLVSHEKRDATCQREGTNAYYACDGCGKLFRDANGLTEITRESLVIPKTSHADEDVDFICDFLCGSMLFTEEVLNDLLYDTLTLSTATVRDYCFFSAINTYYNIFKDHIRIIYDTGANEEYIYNGDSDDGAFNVGSILSEKYDLTCTSDIVPAICFIKEFKNRQVFKYKNSDGQFVGVVVNEDATLLDGILIYDASDNLIYEIKITPETENEIS